MIFDLFYLHFAALSHLGFSQQGTVHSHTLAALVKLSMNLTILAGTVNVQCKCKFKWFIV
jgi:hypothetical protein